MEAISVTPYAAMTFSVPKNAVSLARTYSHRWIWWYR